MTSAIIVTICILLLIAYVFDLSASKTKIPSVILLLFLGWLTRQISSLIGVQIPDLSPLLPVLGTVGLILIVLEGSLELEWQPSKKKIVIQSFWMAFLAIFLQAFLLGVLFKMLGYTSIKTGMANVLPLCIISSSVAIPTARTLTGRTREMVVYESSFSDIIGVLLFNFIAIHAQLSAHTFVAFVFQLILIVIVSFAATLALSFLLKKIEHPIKFIPIILLIILIYEIAKEYELPSLIFIVFLGLFLGNIGRLKQFKWIRKWHMDGISHEIDKFRELSVEAAFLIRALFFILFGYLLKNAEIADTTTMLWSVIIVASILSIRAILLKWMKLPLQPLLYIAPRGLITILLFLSIPVSEQMPALVNKSLVVQVIILTTLLMMIGMMKNKEEKAEEEATEEEEIIILTP